MGSASPSPRGYLLSPDIWGSGEPTVFPPLLPTGVLPRGNHLHLMCLQTPPPHRPLTVEVRSLVPFSTKRNSSPDVLYSRWCVASPSDAPRRPRPAPASRAVSGRRVPFHGAELRGVGTQPVRERSVRILSDGPGPASPDRSTWQRPAGGGLDRPCV